MFTKYSLKDNPDTFKQFIPRNLSRTDLSAEQFQSKYAWCLIANDNANCDCKFPTLSKLINNCRMGRKDLFDGQLDRINKILKADQCIMCHGSGAYRPSDVLVWDDCRRSRSQMPSRSNKIRKSVRFADALGLRLSEIKFIRKSESERAPILTSSAIKDLNLDHNYHLAMQGIKYFSSCFKITSDEKEIHRKTLENGVCLEKAHIEGMTLFGRISVKNVSFEKHVGIRITFNDWKSFKDIYASYILESSNGVFDKFSFSVVIPQFVIVGSKIEFSAFYLCQDGHTFWDNNSNQNYIFECFAKNMGIVTDDGWLHFL